MEIQTKALGIVPIVEKQIIKLEQGFYGFDTYHSFALIDAPQKPFIWVQSLEKADLAFLAIDPFLFRPDYEIDIDDSLLSPLEIESPSDVLVFALITIPVNGSPITANLQGPLIINRKNNRGLQAILTDTRWQTKHDLVAETAVKRGR
jgi:flagellar assembly factor FliW